MFIVRIVKYEPDYCVNSDCWQAPATEGQA